MKKITLKAQILVPLTFALGILFSAFVYYVYHSQLKTFSGDVESRLEGVQELFKKQLASETELLNSIIEILATNQDLQQAWMTKDRLSLLEQSSPLLNELAIKHRITHFNFHNTDQTNFLRVYDPERFGDTINRFTLLEAMKTDHDSAGIELGKQGTMTLRAVHPWQINEQVVGYIEIGEGIDHIIEKLHNVLDVDLYISIYKEFLDKGKGELGIQLLNRSNNWDFSPFAVIISQTLENVPVELKDFLKKGQHDYMEMATNLKLFIDNRAYRVGVVPLFDAGVREIGDILILSDVTAQLSSFNKTILLAGGICTVVGLVLFILFPTLLGKLESTIAESTISDYHNNLELVVAKHKTDLTEALDKIKTLHGILPICTHCKQIRDDGGIWKQMETYISEHSEATFSHGICPDCQKKYYQEPHKKALKKSDKKK